MEELELHFSQKRTSNALKTDSNPTNQIQTFLLYER